MAVFVYLARDGEGEGGGFIWGPSLQFFNKKPENHLNKCCFSICFASWQFLFLAGDGEGGGGHFGTILGTLYIFTYSYLFIDIFICIFMYVFTYIY